MAQKHRTKENTSASKNTYDYDDLKKKKKHVREKKTNV